MIKVTEAHIQALLMRYVMGHLHHLFVIPNSNTFFDWEADLVSLNRSGYLNEFEIKIIKGDYSRDAKKRKHLWMQYPDSRSPAYFWYVTFGFEIDPPLNAGWISVSYIDDPPKYDDWVGSHWSLEIKKRAPLRHKFKMPEHKFILAAKLVSFQLANIMARNYLKES